MSERETPKFTGITVHRDPRGRFAVRYPTDWHTFEIRSDEPLATSDEALVGPVVGDAVAEQSGTDGAGERSDAPQLAARLTGAGQTGVEQTEEEPTEEEPTDAGGDIAAREGLGFAPDPSDPSTAFTVWASSLGETVSAEDLDVLRSGVDEGLQLLPACEVETAGEIVLGNLIRFERIYSFQEGGATRRRKQWLIYVDQWLICLTWQGATLDAYEYWFAMANQSFMTLELPEALWFSADRDLNRR